MENCLIGFIIGFLSLIPGLSSGTILVLTNKYEKLLLYFSKPIVHIKKLLLVLNGAVLGLLLGSKVMYILFSYAFNLTNYFILILLFYSMIKFYKSNIKYHFMFKYFSTGLSLCFLVLILYMINFNSSTNVQINNMFFISFLLTGFIDGFFTILPGISGSMVVMILGMYFIYNYMLSHLKLIYLIFLLIYYIGDFLGLVVGSSINGYFLRTKKLPYINFVFGLLIGSLLIYILRF